MFIVEDEREWRIRPVDKRKKTEFLLQKGDADEARPGDLVRATTVRGRRLGLRRAKVVERLSDLKGPRAISLIAIHQHDIPFDFSDAALDQARKADAAPLGARTDLRDTPLVTIDGSDARDFDDAVYAKADNSPDMQVGLS